jgi:hypothetical protein
MVCVLMLMLMLLLSWEAHFGTEILKQADERLMLLLVVLLLLLLLLLLRMVGFDLPEIFSVRS